MKSRRDLNHQFVGARQATIVALICSIGLCSCAGPARVGDVWSTKHTETISQADRDLFGMDRASHLRVESQLLSPNDTREEFLVTWAGSAVQLVKFEYRQPNVPDKIQVQTFTPAGRHSNKFAVAGDDYTNGGSVSAWRVSLWNQDQLLAEKTSALW